MCSTDVYAEIESKSHIIFPKNFTNILQQEIIHEFEKELQPLILNVLNTKFSNMRRCIASSSSKSKVMKSLQITKQNNFFNNEYIFTSEQVTKGKPNPDLFLFVAKAMGYLCSECIVIEDSIAGIRAAIAAQMQVIGFLGGSHAQFEWYQENIYSENVPIAHNQDELIYLINQFSN